MTADTTSAGGTHLLRSAGVYLPQNPTKRRRHDAPANPSNIDAFLDSIDEETLASTSEAMMRTQTVLDKEFLARLLSTSLREPDTYPPSNVPADGLSSLTASKYHKSLRMSEPSKFFLREQGKEVLSAPYPAMLERIGRSCIPQREAPSSTAIDVYLVAAIESANKALREHADLSKGIRLNLAARAEWPQSNIPYAALAYEDSMTSIEVSQNVRLIKYIDIDLKSDLINDTYSKRSTSATVPLAVIEAKGLNEEGGEMQAIAQGIAVCRKMKGNLFLSCLTSGNLWRFFVVKAVPDTAKYEVFRSVAVIAKEDPSLIVGLLKTAILEDPEQILELLCERSLQA